MKGTRTQRHNTARSSIGAGYRSFKAERGVQFPYGLLTSGRSELVIAPIRGTGDRQFGHRSADRPDWSPTVLTKRRKQHRAEVQLGARLVWDQEVFGSNPRCPTQERSSRAGCPCSADNRAALSSILRATTERTRSNEMLTRIRLKRIHPTNTQGRGVNGNTSDF